MSLCPEAEMRAAMTDAEFWEHVFHGDDGPDDPADIDESYRSAFGHWPDLPVTPCEVCGSAEEACGYDTEGRPMIHTSEAS